MRKKISLTLLVICLFQGCKKKELTFEEQYDWTTIKVTASAYNSLANQTEGNPNITAFGDTLKLGDKYIAVSRDLMRKGLKYNTPVKIDTFQGVYWVKDKMHYRWKNKIDIYMGNDVKMARKWGRRKVNISYGTPKVDISIKK